MRISVFVKTNRIVPFSHHYNLVQPTEIRDDADAAVDYVPEDGGDEDEEIDDDDEDAGVSQIYRTSCGVAKVSLLICCRLSAVCFMPRFLGRRR